MNYWKKIKYSHFWYLRNFCQDPFGKTAWATKADTLTAPAFRNATPHSYSVPPVYIQISFVFLLFQQQKIKIKLHNFLNRAVTCLHEIIDDDNMLSICRPVLNCNPSNVTSANFTASHHFISKVVKHIWKPFSSTIVGKCDAVYRKNRVY